MSGHRVALGRDDYYRGSNGLVLENAIVLLTASLASGKSSYRHAALDQLHYVLGRNALGKSFLTGFGSDPPLRPISPAVDDASPAAGAAGPPRRRTERQRRGSA